MQAYFVMFSWSGLFRVGEIGAALLPALDSGFYQNLWFMGLNLVLVTLSLYGWYRWQLRRLRTEHREFAQAAAALRESEEKFKTAHQEAEQETCRRNEESERRVQARIAALQESEARYRKLVEHSPDVIVVICGGKVVYANPIAAELYGVQTPREIIGKPMLDFVHPDNQALMAERFHKILALGLAVPPVEMKARNIEGNYIDVEVTDIPFTYEDRPAVQVVLRDISERKKAEQALFESDQRLRRQYSALAELVHSKVFQHGEQLAALQEIAATVARCLNVNRVGVWFYDEARSKIVCQNLYELNADRHSQGQQLCCTVYPAYFKALLEERYIKADDARRDPRTSEFAAANLVPDRITSLLDAPIQVAGKLVGVVRHEHVGPPRHWRLDEQVFTSAVTDLIALLIESRERRQSEEQIRRHTEELENLVDERTKRIRELERQRAENEKLAATGRMAARIAHEINNPLAGIKNSFRLIKKAVPVTHAHYEYSGLIESEIDRIANIVRQMFDLYRPDYEAVRNFPADFAIRDVITLLKGSCLERRVTIEVAINTTRLTVALSENSLRQVLYNVMQNAIDASPAEATIKITADLERDYLVIRVADSGKGIPEEIRPRIFEPFFTTKSGYSRSGLGLGLSVSKSLVEAMHGMLGYETVVGKGTTFWIALPLASVRRDILSPAVTRPALVEQN